MAIVYLHTKHVKDSLIIKGTHTCAHTCVCAHTYTQLGRLSSWPEGVDCFNKKKKNTKSQVLFLLYNFIRLQKITVTQYIEDTEIEVEKMKDYTFINSLPSKDNCNTIQKVVSKIREMQII